MEYKAKKGNVLLAKNPVLEGRNLEKKWTKRVSIDWSFVILIVIK